MLKCYNYDIVFQEIPNEVSLAFNLSLCPNRCRGCHSPWLWKDVGEEVTEDIISFLIGKYLGEITCFVFMGGDNSPKDVNMFAEFIKKKYPSIKTAWYSGKEVKDENIVLKNFDYIKLGAYNQELGALKSKTTNQHLYKIINGKQLEDITFLFHKK